jgi:hypothetical protein
MTISQLRKRVDTGPPLVVTIGGFTGRVEGVYPNLITLRGTAGYCESFRLQDPETVAGLNLEIPVFPKFTDMYKSLWGHMRGQQGYRSESNVPRERRLLNVLSSLRTGTVSKANDIDVVHEVKTGGQQ